MVTLSSVLERTADIRYRLVGDEAVVVRQTTAEIAGLNEVAARLFDLLDGELTVTEIVESVLEEYEVERDRLQGDALELLDRLEEMGLVAERPGARR